MSRWKVLQKNQKNFLIIEIEPDHAEAYFERSGTHYHNKDMASAVRDLKKACELGNKKACKRYNMVKKEF